MGFGRRSTTAQPGIFLTPSTLLLSFFLATLLVGTFGGSALAETSKLKQQILPLDCVFQTVNDGSGTLIYLTPTECGQVITPPDPDPGGGGTNPPVNPGSNTGGQGTPPRAVITTINTGSAIVQVPFVAVSNTDAARLRQILGSVQYLPYEPLAQIRESSSSTNENGATIGGSSVPAPVVALGLITLLIVVLILVL